MKRTSQKLRVFENLHSLNQGFEQVLGDLVRLQQFPFFRNRHLRGVQVLVEEARAWANFELVGVLQGREQNDWTRLVGCAGSGRHATEIRMTWPWKPPG